VILADEGTFSAGSISNRTRQENWTLDQVGNWDLNQVDLNGDVDFVDANELNDDRTHNVVNELTARDTDDNGTLVDPLREPAVHGALGAELAWQVLPLGAVVEHPEGAADGLPRVCRRPPALRLCRRVGHAVDQPIQLLFCQL
jgi:hypothetical protein